MKKINTYNKIALAISVLLFLVIVPSAWPQIKLGTSGGNINDINQIKRGVVACCGGTLGSLVQDNIDGTQYILSNNHVLAKTNQGIIGEDIISPGLNDQKCLQDSIDAVANLSDFVPISFKRRTTNTVDAAIAQVRKDCFSSNNLEGNCVDPSGSIVGIGPVSGSIVPPKLKMQVQKSGRTPPGLTYGEVTAVNATVSVTYYKTCGVGSQTAIFTGQIMIGPSGFSAPGDSGSLMVENCSPYPRAVGLLFAGSSTFTVANPISNVLSSLGDVSMVGAEDYCPSNLTGSSSMTTQSQLPPQANRRAVEAVSKVRERHEETILSIEGVVGIGVGLSETVPDEVVIEVYAKKPLHEMKHMIPEMLEGVPVKVVETGEIIAY